MYGFKTFLAEGIRVGIPHILPYTTPNGNPAPSLTHEQLGQFLPKDGKLRLGKITEKTDGQTFRIGYDHDGFYTQHSGSGSEKIRQPEGHLERAIRQNPKGLTPEQIKVQEAFGKFHKSLQSNKELIAHLKATHEARGGSDVSIQGEAFNRHLSSPSDTHPGHVKFVHTSYDPKHMGTSGSFIVHTGLPHNKGLDLKALKGTSNSTIRIDDDVVHSGNGSSHIDASEERRNYDSLNHDILRARTTPSNKKVKTQELAKLDDIKRRLHGKIGAFLSGAKIKPKWGSAPPEGIVLHPHKSNPNAPAVKMINPEFKAAKEGSGNSRFGKLNEGGNIKVKTANGDVGAQQISVTSKNRRQVSGDISDALHHLHRDFHVETGKHLFGRDGRKLKNGSVYSGSTEHLMSPGKISDEEFARHKPKVGDVDLQIDPKHKDELERTLKPGKKYGKYTVVGTKKSGTELHAIMRHENGEHHQFDFDSTENPGSKNARFSRSSSWEDAKSGIKGFHHKMLLNAIGGDRLKYSSLYGLRSRTDSSDPGSKRPERISQRLFGDNADHSKIHSFKGLVHSIKHHIPAEQHQQIYDRVKHSFGQKKDIGGSEEALAHMRKELGVKDTVSESEDPNTHHTSVIPLAGMDPISHMGHAKDLGGKLASLPGTKHVGISAKSGVFSPKERTRIISRQWRQPGTKFHVVSSAGEILKHAHDSLPEHGRKILHLVVGHDRSDFAEKLKASVEAGRIKELEGKKFDEVHIHYPSGNRTHGMSGTKMRQAASEGDEATFEKHLGPMFTPTERKSIMSRTRAALSSGKLSTKRKS